MRIRVSQQTSCEYAPPAKSLIQTLRMTPRNHEGQFVVRWRIDVDVEGRLRQGEDAFGNITHSLSAAGPIETLVITVDGEVETHDTAGVMRGTVERFPEQLYLRESNLAAADEAIRAFADRAAKAAGPDTLARLHALMDGLNGRIGPAPAGEEPDTAAAAFAKGAGSAQDAAHAFIAAARHLEIPSRFVSGFVLRDGPGPQDQGHAWAESFVPGLGWVAFDPLLNICPAGGHVRVAIGIDALGASPLRGSGLGGAETRADRVRVVARETPFHAQSQSQTQS
ncbi:MAG: transglutaminase domain-containing protein [Alsobacter sp.]